MLTCASLKQLAAVAAGLAICWHTAPAAPASRVAAPSALCLQGAYIQLVDNNAGWGEAAWQALFDSLKALQIDSIVVQWSAYDNTAFYRSQRLSTTDAVPVDTILAMADRAGMRVLLGLSHDSAYWKNVQGGDKRAYLTQRLARNMVVAAELLPLAKPHPSFAGWYISEEIDDLNWRALDEREALFSYLWQLSAFLRTLDARKTIAVSGFANRQTSPEDLERFWKALLGRAIALDTVYFQDGIGVHKLDIDQVGRYYQALGNAARSAGRVWVPVIETFEQTSGQPMSEQAFAAVPAAASRLKRQIQAATRYTARRIAFGIPEYLTPSGGEAAGKRLAEHLRAMQDGAVVCPARQAAMPERRGRLGHQKQQ